MHKIIRTIRFALPVVVLLLSLSCGGEKKAVPGENRDTAAQGKSGGSVTYRVISAPDTFNYLMADDEPSLIVAFYLLNSRLIDFDHRSRSYIPALAESWNTGPDGRTVDIKLREGLKFSDGDDLTTEDVVFTLKAIYDERTNSPAFRDSLLIDGKPIEARVIDGVRMQLVFPKPVATVETYLTNFGVLPSHALKDHLDGGKLAEVWKTDADPKTVIGGGPFIVESVAPGERVTLSRNPHYWKKDTGGAQLPYLDKVVVEVVQDPNNAISKLLQSQLDIVDKIRPADYASLVSESAGAKAVDLGPGMATDYLWFNLNQAKSSGERLDNKAKYKWFGDKRFRQAVAYAIDRNSIAANALRGLATPLYGFVSPANQALIDKNLPNREYDLEKARQLLKSAGFTSTGSDSSQELKDSDGNPVEFTLIVPAGNEPRMLMATVIQEDLARLGIKMQIAPIEMPSLSERWAKSFDYDAILLGLAVTDYEPSSFANFLLSSGAVHQWRPLQKTPATDWESKVDLLFNQQAIERDAGKRAALFSEIQQTISEESPIIPVVVRHVLCAANTRIGNYAPSVIMPNSMWNADELFIKQ